MTIRLSSPSAILAAALLLAAFPALADDLLDAVLWDGPPSSRTAPAPSTPPPAVPDVPSVPPVSSGPSVPSAPQPPPAPATSDPVPGETQIRHEIQEMRARADRLEAALGPAAPPKPARPPYDRADWPERARLAVNGFGVFDSNDGSGFAGEFTYPVADTPFDVAMRGCYLKDEPDAKYGYISSNRRSVSYESKTVMGATVWGIWYPWRGALVSPHAGIGAGYESTSGDREYWEYRIGRWNRENHSGKSLDDDGLTLAGRVGATLTCKRFTLKGEFILTAETKTLLAEAGLRLWEHFVLNALVERYDVDLSDACTAFGGGCTILF